MYLSEFKDHILSFPNGTQFNYGISRPFSWRGSYDEVAFSIVEEPTTREEIMDSILLAYTEVFYGYKGGEYRYGDYTRVNFEDEGNGNYSNGEYTSNIIAKIENAEVYRSQEERLIKLAFRSNNTNE